MLEKLGKEIISIISDVSGFDESDITIETNLEKELEIDSIKAIEIAVAIEKKYKVSVRDEEIPNLVTPKIIIDTVMNLLKQKEN